LSNTENNQNKALEDLKVLADNLGIKYQKNIGFENLEKKVRGAEAEKKAAIVAEPKKLTPKQVNKMRATSLSKVRIVNLDKENLSASTVFSGVHNMKIDLARVVPLDMDIALEEALIQDIEKRKMIVGKAIIDPVTKKPNGNFRMIEAPMYAVTRY